MAELAQLDFTLTVLAIELGCYAILLPVKGRVGLRSEESLPPLHERVLPPCWLALVPGLRKAGRLTVNVWFPARS